MTLLIPPEFNVQVNKYSGYISPRSPYAKKTLKGLFYSPENERYLAQQLYILITNPTFVERHTSQPSEDYRDYNGWGYRTGFGNGIELDARRVQRLCATFRDKAAFLAQNIDQFLDMHPLPYSEDLFVANPIMQLHDVNRAFLLKTAQNIIQNPTMIEPRFFAINDETGQDESEIEFNYTSESYADGVWHPEHLFTNSKRNRYNPPWQPVDVNFYTDPDSVGLCHRYYNKWNFDLPINQSDRKKRGISGTVNAYAHSQRTRSQFPRWQDAGSNRAYDYDNYETLVEGGSSDRRVQRPHGYNMSALVSRSTY